MRRKVLAVGVIIGIVVFAGLVWGEELSIYDIQYTTDANGVSGEDGNIVDCRGGIVVHNWVGSRTRLVLYDPNYAEGWGGIMAKDRYGVGVFGDVNVGDWVSLSNLEVEEFRGTTFLQYKGEHDPDYRIVSRGNALPEPLLVGVDEIAAPVEGVDAWVVADHEAEKYECMLVKVGDVYVQDRGLGKAYDNYVLASNEDANLACWASDYMNEDNEEIYHRYVQPGARFCGVVGILEQYKGESDGIGYDYYQLLTRTTEDFMVEQYCDMNYDCGVDFVDFGLLGLFWLTEEQCRGPDWCGGTDVTQDGFVDGLDLKEFGEHWLAGKY